MGRCRLTQTQDVGGTAIVTYDAAGHITNDGTNTYAYSDRGRMVSATTPGGAVTYVYNGVNQRVGKSGPTALVPTGAAYYLYDEAGQLLGEYDANGAPVYETIYLGSLPVGVLKQTGTAATSDIAVTLYNVHADHIATARIITKQDQTIVWRWDSAEAFGATAPDQNPSSLGIFSFNQRFPGQVFDAETGLFQNWNREYNARQGRYVESDPIGLVGGINTFAYTDNQPLRYVDRDGRFVFLLAPLVPLAPIVAEATAAAVGVGLAWWISQTLDPVMPPDPMQTAAGNVADTKIVQDYNEYASSQRLCGNQPMDRCKWLEENASKYPRAAVIATQKAWGCRRRSPR